MKKFVFATMLLCTVSISASAKTANSEPKVKVNECDAPDCRNRGGLCATILTINGVTRLYKFCCDDVIIIEPRD